MGMEGEESVYITVLMVPLNSGHPQYNGKS